MRTFRFGIIAAILTIALACRLYHVTLPVEGWHAWRQADTADMARNFYDHGFNIARPQVSHNGDSPSTVDAEFPLFQYLVALTWAIAGVSDAWGRGISIASSLVTLCLLYGFARRYIGENAALWSAFIYAILPLNVYYARAFMPNAFVLMWTMAGLYFYARWLETNKRPHFFLSAISTSLAVMINPTTLVIGMPLAFLARIRMGPRWIRTPSLWLYASVAILPAVAWFTYSRIELYSPQLSIGLWTFGTDKWGNLDLILTPKFYNDVFLKNIAERHLTYAATIPFVAGLFLPRQNQEERVFDWWLVAVILYILIVAKGNDVHEYYQLPFILPAVVYVGKIFARYLTPDQPQPAGQRRWRWLFWTCLAGTLILSGARYAESFASREIENSPTTRLANEVAARTEPGDLLVTVSEGDAVVLYRSHRRGWVLLPGKLDSSAIMEKIGLGARYLAGLKSVLTDEAQRSRFELIRRHFPAVVDDSDYFILSLTEPVLPLLPLPAPAQPGSH